jgi:hypothetical protein
MACGDEDRGRSRRPGACQIDFGIWANSVEEF